MQNITFDCPRCKKRSATYYYKSHRAGCLNCGWLLSTEIPDQVKLKDKDSFLNKAILKTLNIGKK